MKLDDPSRPIAETYRRLAHRARELHLFRPSYEHIRRLVRIVRRFRDLRRTDTSRVLFEVMYNLRPPTALVDHLLDAGPTRPP